MRRYYRGEYGHTAPVTVIPAVALDFDGRLRQHYYNTEAEAWAAILGSVAEGSEHAEERYRKAEAELDAATDDMVRRRAHERAVTNEYQTWRQRHPLAQSA